MAFPLWKRLAIYTDSGTRRSTHKTHHRYTHEHTQRNVHAHTHTHTLPSSTKKGRKSRDRMIHGWLRAKKQKQAECVAPTPGLLGEEFVKLLRLPNMHWESSIWGLESQPTEASPNDTTRFSLHFQCYGNGSLQLIFHLHSILDLALT